MELISKKELIVCNVRYIRKTKKKNIYVPVPTFKIKYDFTFTAYFLDY